MLTNRKQGHVFTIDYAKDFTSSTEQISNCDTERTVQ